MEDLALKVQNRRPKANSDQIEFSEWDEPDMEDGEEHDPNEDDLDDDVWVDDNLENDE